LSTEGTDRTIENSTVGLRRRLGFNPEIHGHLNDVHIVIRPPSSRP